MKTRQLPAEWSSQAAMLLVWPRAGGDWGDNLQAARDAIAGMASALAPDQTVIIAAADNECRASIANHAELAGTPNARLRIVDAPSNDIWARDTGPITVLTAGQRIFVDCRFDGWGGQFESALDDDLTACLYESGALGTGTLEYCHRVLEGGSIDSNGAGTVLTTDRCLIAANRNPGLDRSGAERLVHALFGTDTVHWLEYGELIGDDTDGHIDTLARFIDVRTIVYQGCDDKRDDHYGPLNAMADQLAGLRDRQDRPYRLAALPLPAPIHDRDDGHRLPAGYANFLIGNRCVLVPAFNDPADAAAQTILAELFADRDIVPIDSRALIHQHGSLHCAAMQIPAEPAA